MTNTADIVKNMRIDLVAIKKKITDGSKENLTINKEIINSSNKLVNFRRRSDSVLIRNTAATSDSNTLYKEQTLRNSPVKKQHGTSFAILFKSQQQNYGTTKCNLKQFDTFKAARIIFFKFVASYCIKNM